METLPIYYRDFYNYKEIFTLQGQFFWCFGFIQMERRFVMLIHGYLVPRLPEVRLPQKPAVAAVENAGEISREIPKENRELRALAESLRLPKNAYKPSAIVGGNLDVTV